MEVPRKPSEVTQAIWISMADTYDVYFLGPLWHYTTHALQRRPQLRSGPLLMSVAHAIAVVQHYGGQDVDEDSVTDFYLELVGTEVQWIHVQRAVQDISAKWRALGL